MKSVTRLQSPASHRPACESKRLIALLLILLAALPAFAQSATAANQPAFTFTASGPHFTAVAVDSRGNTYLAGSAIDGQLPVTPGAFQTNGGGLRLCGSAFVPLLCNIAFVVKLDPSGAVVYATYLHGSANDVAYGIAVDGAGDAYVTGSTTSLDFPVTEGAAFTTPSAKINSGGFLVELNPAGTALVYGTYLPGMTPLALAIDSAGNAYATGYTSGPAARIFPVTSGAFQTSAVNSQSVTSGVAIKVKASGSEVAYATFLSGSGASDLSQGDIPQAIAVDAAGNVVIAGYTGSPDFPVTAGAYLATRPGAVGGFAAKLDATGSALLFSTYLAASQGPMDARFDSQGGAYITGNGNISVTPDAYQSTPAGAFLAHVSPAGALQYATELPFATGSSAAIDVDTAGNLVIAGSTTIARLPTPPGAFQSALTGAANIYILKFSPSNGLLGATYLGGSAIDQSFRIVANRDGSVTVTGFSNSSDFPGVPLKNLQSYAFATNLFPALTVQNAADYSANTVAPGEIVAIRGYGIGPAAGVIAQLTADSSLPATVAGVTVQFDGFTAPLFYAQGRQINVQVPWEIAGQQSTQVQVQYQTPSGLQQFGPVAFAVLPAAPGVFYVNNSDGTTNTPANPAKRGDYIALYGTGGGLTTPAGITGGVWPLTNPLPNLGLPVMVTIGGENATVLFSGAAPYQSSGVFQMNVLIPADLPASGTYLVVKVDGIASAPFSVPIALR